MSYKTAFNMQKMMNCDRERLIFNNFLIFRGTFYPILKLKMSS